MSYYQKLARHMAQSDPEMAAKFGAHLVSESKEAAQIRAAKVRAEGRASEAERYAAALGREAKRFRYKVNHQVAAVEAMEQRAMEALNRAKFLRSQVTS